MPKGAWSNSRIFFSSECGAWSVQITSIVPSARPAMQALTCSWPRKGGLILQLESNVRRHSSVSVK